MKNLSDFKRYLATPDAELRLAAIEHLNLTTGEWMAKPPHNADWRKVAKVQSNAIALITPTTKSGSSWLYFGKASEWTFNADNALAISANEHTRLTYEYRVAQERN